MLLEITSDLKAASRFLFFNSFSLGGDSSACSRRETTVGALGFVGEGSAMGWGCRTQSAVLYIHSQTNDDVG